MHQKNQDNLAKIYFRKIMVNLSLLTKTCNFIILISNIDLNYNQQLVRLNTILHFRKKKQQLKLPP